MIVEIPIRTKSALNSREHWRARSKRVRSEREAVAIGLMKLSFWRPSMVPPYDVVLTRVGPTNGLDPFDNLPSALKGCADQVAEWLGVDDRRTDLVKFACEQLRAPKWAVLIQIKPRVAA